METPRSSISASPTTTRRREIRGGDRRRSRLQMHAPASIQVAPAESASSLSGWQTAIPLLSPLDTSPIQSIDGSVKDEVSSSSSSSSSSRDRSEKDNTDPVTVGASSWRHPAEPFYCENLQGKNPGFVFTHCGR